MKNLQTIDYILQRQNTRGNTDKMATNIGQQAVISSEQQGTRVDCWNAGFDGLWFRWWQGFSSSVNDRSFGKSVKTLSGNSSSRIKLDCTLSEFQYESYGQIPNKIETPVASWEYSPHEYNKIRIISSKFTLSVLKIVFVAK